MNAAFSAMTDEHRLENEMKALLRESSLLVRAVSQKSVRAIVGASGGMFARQS